jgi:hypothetical protein
MAKHINESFESKVVTKKLQELEMRISGDKRAGAAGAANARKLATHYFQKGMCTMQLSPSPDTPDAFELPAAKPANKKAKK